MAENKKIIILIFLAILAALSLIYGIIAPSREGYKKPSPEFSFVADEQGGLTADKETADFNRQGKRTDYISWRRNPFTLKKSAGELVLNGILWDKEKPVAVINDVELSVGDKIEGSVIIAIEPQAVILNNGAENFELRLWVEE